jgi:hypothetical protein
MDQLGDTPTYYYVDGFNKQREVTVDIETSGVPMVLG